MNGAAIAEQLRGYRFQFGTEAALQHALERILAGQAQREVRLSRTDRIDFLAGRVGIEVKVGGSVTAVAAQLARYTLSDRIDELVLVTSCNRHRRLPARINGKPVHLVLTFMGGI